MNSTENTRAKISVAELKKRRYENYLKLKKEFENDKRSKSDPPKEKQMRATFLHCFRYIIWNSFINSCNASN
jgi:hypothetical protein